MSGEKARLEELRIVLRSESTSYGELAELQSLAEFIEPDDVELLEAAGVPEFPEDRVNVEYAVTISVPVDSPAPTCDDIMRAIYLGTDIDRDDPVVVTSEASAL